MKDALKEVLGIFITMGVIIFIIFAVLGEMEMAFYGLLFIGFVFLLVFGVAFLKSRGINPEEVSDNIKDFGDALQEGQDAITYSNMNKKERAMYNAIKKNKKKE